MCKIIIKMTTVIAMYSSCITNIMHKQCPHQAPFVGCGVCNMKLIQGGHWGKIRE